VAGKDRKRQVARERYQRRMVAKAQARAKARRRTAMGLSFGAVIAIVAVVLAITLPSNNKKASSASSPASSPAASPAPPVPTSAAGCTTKPSVVATPIANFPVLPAGVDAQLKTEPTVTVPAGAVPTKTTVKDIIVGTGAATTPKDNITLNYLGVNYVDCVEFDSSWARDQMANYPLDQVIPGFTKGIGGDSASGIAPMKVGGRREIIVPPADGYGATGNGAVGPNEVLIFVVDLIATSTPSASPGASAPAASATPSATPSSTPAVSPSVSPTVSPAASASK
jgi:peptidylprolyl isomerase